jgi:hypothetical protein
MPDTWKYSARKFGLTVLTTSLGFVLVQLDVSIVNVALAKIGTEGPGLPVYSGSLILMRWLLQPYYSPPER